MLKYVQPSNYCAPQQSEHTNDEILHRSLKHSDLNIPDSLVKIEDIIEIPKIEESELLKINTFNLLPKNNKVKFTFLFNSDPAFWEINADIMKCITENIPNQNIDKGFIRYPREIGGETRYVRKEYFLRILENGCH